MSEFEFDDSDTEEFSDAELERALGDYRLAKTHGYYYDLASVFMPDFLENAASYCIEIAKFDESLDLAEALLSHEPHSAEAWRLKSVALANLERREEAFLALDEAYCLQPNEVENFMAHAAIMEVFNDPDAAIELYDKILACASGNEEALFNKGSVLSKASRWGEAIAVFRSLLNSAEFSFDALIETGICYDGLGNYEKAVEIYKRCSDIEPFDCSVWFNLAVIYCHAEQFNNAIECYDYALAIDEKFTPALYNKANALCGIGRLEEAISHYREALVYDAKDGAVWHNLGSAYQESGEYALAINAFTEALEATPSNYESLFNRGACYDALEQFDKAVDDYNAAIEIKSDDAEAWFAKGDALYNASKNNEALECYDAGLRIDPLNVERRLDYGVILFEGGRHDEAGFAFARVIEQMPDWSEGYYALAKVMASLKDFDVVTKLLLHAIRIEPSKFFELYADFAPIIGTSAVGAIARRLDEIRA